MRARGLRACATAPLRLARSGARCLAMMWMMAGSAVAVPPPRVWGGSASASSVAGGCSGYLFGFSGLDGPTTELSELVAVAQQNKSFSLQFCAIASPRTLTLDGPREDVQAATGDVIVAGKPGSQQLRVAWVSANLLAGQSPPGQNISLSHASPSPLVPPGASAELSCVQSSVSPELVLALCTHALAPGGGVAWGFAADAKESSAVKLASTAACDEGQPGCAIHLSELIVRRLKPYSSLPAAGPFAPLLAKSLSVMRVNALSREGK